MNQADPIAYTDVELVPWTSKTSEEVRWSSGYFAYGGSGAEESTSVYYEIPPGKRLGRHSNTAEETQLLIAGRGVLVTEEASLPLNAGDVFVVPEGQVHDIRSTGPEPIRAIGFFAAPRVEHHWCDDEWTSGEGRITGTPNRD